MAKVNVKLLNVVAGKSGTFYGVNFTAIGKGKLAKDRQSFVGLTLVAEGVDDKIVGSLIDADLVEKITDKAVQALKDKAEGKKPKPEVEVAE